MQAAETAVIGTAVNETRFQYYRSATQAIANTDAPAVLVLGSFYDGGSPVGRSFDTQNSYEFQNYTSMVRGTHSLRFGVRLRGTTDDSISPQNFNGTFTFGGIEQYQLTLGRRAARLHTRADSRDGRRSEAVHHSRRTARKSPPARWTSGSSRATNGASRPNLTLSVGLRYETQTNIRDRGDLAPRVAVAWAPGGGKGKAKTVVRAGMGIFYERFGLANTLTAARHDGIVQQQYVVPDPDFYPIVPAISTLAGLQTTQIVERVSSSLRAPYIIQSAVTVERQLPAKTTVAATFTNSHGTASAAVRRAAGSGLT